MFEDAGIDIVGYDNDATDCSDDFVGGEIDVEESSPFFFPLFFCFSFSLLSSSSSISSASLSFLFYAGGSRGSNDVLDRGFVCSVDNQLGFRGFVGSVDHDLFCRQYNILVVDDGDAHRFCCSV